MIWNGFYVEKQHTDTYLFICQFLNVNSLFSDLLGVWLCPLKMIRNILAKKWQLKHYVSWKAAVKLENLPESGLF